MHRVWAKIMGEPQDQRPTCHMQGSVDFEQAAHSQVVEFLESSDGETKRGAVLVWTGEDDQKVEKMFDWTADFDMPEVTDIDDEEAVEISGEIELTERT
jgi:hypothetical protein